MTAIQTKREMRLGIPNDVQLELISRRLRELYKMRFPITREFGGVLQLSTHKLEPQVRNILTSKKYRVELHPHGRMLLMMPREHFSREVMWWFDDDKTDVTLEAWWRVDPRGVTIILETNPMGGDGNHEFAVILAKDLRECGERMHTHALDLIAQGGKIVLPWDKFLPAPVSTRA